jgi:hypothetical protein
MLEAKQKAEAALNKLHQRMSSKAAQPDTNPFLVAPAVEQLPAQLLAAAAAAAAAGVAGTSAKAAASAEDAAAAAAAAAPSAAADAAQNGSSASVPAAAAAEQQQQQQQHTQLPLLLQQQSQQQAVAAAAEYDEEDALFEQAAVLKAFSSILPARLIEKELRGSRQDQQQQQQQQKDQQAEEKRKQQDDGVVEDVPMDIDVPDGAAAGDAADAATEDGSWLGWKQQQQQQGTAAAGAAAAAGTAALAEAEVLRFGIDSLAAGRRAALSLAGGKGPQDVYEQQGKQQGRVAGVGGARQRKSKYDADPKVGKAEGILNSGPEAVFEAVGGMWDTGNGME